MIHAGNWQCPLVFFCLCQLKAENMNSLTSVRRPLAAMLLLLFTFGLPLRGWSCEPIIPLYQLLSGSSLVGPALLIHSFAWLVTAVSIKCGAFVFLERRLPWRAAVLYMLAANIVSTIPGALIGVFTASLGGVIIAAPIVFFLGWVVQRRLSHLPQPGRPRWISGGAATIAFVAFFILSVVLFGLAGSALEARSFASYWIFKFIFVAMAAAAGIFISAVLEECVIARLSRHAHGNISFYTPVLRANYLTLAVVLLVAALEMLPRRLSDPNFIASWLQSLATMLGFT